MNNTGMKRLFLLTAAVICAFLASCSGNSGDEGMLVISADKTDIQTGTGEIVTFTVRYGSEDVRIHFLPLFPVHIPLQLPTSPALRKLSAKIRSRLRFQVSRYLMPRKRM